MADRAPSGLSKRAGALWRAVLEDYELSSAELELLRCALVALDRADQAAATVKAEGVTVLDRYGSPKAHPACDIEARNRALFARFVAQLGVKMPAEEPVSSRRARHAAQARWGRERRRVS